MIGDPMGLIDKPYAAQALIGAEYFCAILVAVGLFTRLTSLPIAYAMGLAAFIVHAADPMFLGENITKAQEPALVYFLVFTAIFFTGPGRFSLDHLFFGARARLDD
jgi:putative oxidoreductase